MAKVKSKWICQECGYETAGYLGKCPECGSWGSLVEEVQYNEKMPNAAANEFVNTEKPKLLKDIQIGEEVRVSTNISEFDRILGGGFVQGSLILLAGDPGIGKSTITLQTCGRLCDSGKKILYVSAEESASQLRLRAERLNINSDNLYIYPQTSMDNIKSQIEEIQPDFVIIDSIQAIYSNNVASSAGSVSQIRECTNILMHIAKSKNITTIVIGHVTKDGNIAGPKVLEHMVDTVIYFEGDKYKSYRMLRSMKNRFGNTSEVGIFEMCTDGLHEVTNPNELFLNERSRVAAPGSAIIVTNEGTRPLMVEIQALVGTTSYAAPRRVTNGVDLSRLHQILAVLEKRVGLNFSKQDVYVNVMGGIEVDEPSADLGIALAVATCARDVVVDPQTVIIGEIGLSGEIHPVNNIEKRLNEAAAAGFKKAIIPYANNVPKDFDKLLIIKVKRLVDAIVSCVSAN
ncbi:MAG: DNA repair protein RadA [Candidatus Gastranaerophilaceae bacterium]|nr:DNA repair protein RadA [Candidatus Gastranaerophilaceae bacterium]